MKDFDAQRCALVNKLGQGVRKEFNSTLIQFCLFQQHPTVCDLNVHEASGSSSESAKKPGVQTSSN